MAVLNRPTSHALGGRLGRRLGIPGLGLLAAGFVAAAALLPVAQSSNATATGHEIRLLEARRADLEARLHAGQAEIAALGSIERIDQEARGRLGMIPATSWIHVQVNQAAPVTGVPARYFPEVAASEPAPDQPFWKSVLSKLPLP